MNWYFFDRVSRQRSEYDFNGQTLASPDAARQFAELIAIDLEVSEEGNWSGWAINVRDASGKQFFSVSVSPLTVDLVLV